MQDRPYKSLFAKLQIKPLVAEEKDKYLAMASLADVARFLPQIDTAKNSDLLPVAFNACVVNRVNKNMDVVDTATALAMYRNFIYKPINVEHNRQRVVGSILTAGFSEFGTDKPLTEEQVKTMTGPFYITLGGLVWRTVNEDLADFIEDSSDPSSTHYLEVSASWELGFGGYNIALLEGNKKNLADATRIVTDPTEVQAIQDKLVCLGGDGKFNDLFAYRMPAYDVLPLGIGFTEKPAAEVKGIATPPKEQVGVIIKKVEDKATLPDDAKVVGEQNQNKISQSTQSDVKIERKQVFMKITSLQDITDESLKQCTASAVSDFISTELKKGSDVWEKEKTALSEQLAKAKTDSEKLTAEQAKLQTTLQDMQKQVETLAAEKAEREKVEKFNARMATVSEQYELDDEARAAIVEDIKGIDTDENFEKWLTKAKVLLKGFAKKKGCAKCGKSKAECKCEDDEEMESKKCKAAAEAAAKEAETKAAAEAAAKAAAASAVGSAVDNANKDKGGLPNGSSAATPTMKEKYATAFAKENFVITTR
jgi:hypothetical protein